MLDAPAIIPPTAIASIINAKFLCCAVIAETKTIIIPIWRIVFICKAYNVMSAALIKPPRDQTIHKKYAITSGGSCRLILLCKKYMKNNPTERLPYKIVIFVSAGT